MTDQFVVARNPDPDWRLPFLVSLPVDGGIFLETRESWPRGEILWRTAKVTRRARPGARVPKRRASGLKDLHITVYTRERYPYRFANRSLVTERGALAVGDCAVKSGNAVVASVKRKTVGI